ncbi:MAG: WYL domain-containing protein, partial [Actinobacteria bacterium]|nr:WYL domain-containing protein [Actinomycetota bacterium]
SNSCVEIKYGAAIDQKVTQRIIEPIALQANEGVVYVRAFCRSSEAMRTFRVDRILQASALDEPGNSQNSVSADFAISSPTLETRLRMLPEMLESFAPETVSNVTAVDNLIEATVSVTNGAWLASLVLASAGDIEVLSPQDLRDQVVQKAKKWLQA